MSTVPEDSGRAIVELIRAVDLQRENVHTQSLDISFNELADMVEHGELDIRPDYQRLFQWSEGARSRFVESLMLEMPVPPLYVVELEDNKKLLIDGLQRLSSYLHFRGLLDAPHLRPPVTKGQMLRLQDCDILPRLNGLTFQDLGTALQIKLRRSFVRVEVIRKGSNPKFKYHMFKRLNTGGEALTAQQLRNCTIRLLSNQFNDFINGLADNDENFRMCITTISEEQMYGAYDKELVLRFFAFKNWREKFRHDVTDFLTEYMEAVSDPDTPLEFDYQAQKAAFAKTFQILAMSLGDRAFGRANPIKKGEIMRGFGIYHFEAFTLGLQSILDKVDLGNQSSVEKIREVVKQIKLDTDFIALTTGGGKNSPGPLNARISFVQSKLESSL